MASAREHILINRLSSIGDVVFALPALSVLRRARPDSRISWVVEDRAADILKDHPHLDEVIIMPRRQWRKMRAEGHSRWQVLGAMRQFARELAAHDIDITLDFQGNLKSGLVTQASGASLKIGFSGRETKEPNWLFTNKRVDLNAAVMHRIDRDIHLLSALGIDFDYQPAQLHFGPDDKVAVDDFLQALPPGGPLVVLNPGTSNWFKSKRWDPDYYASLSDWLVRVFDARVILNWGPDEVGVIEAIKGATVSETHRAPDLKNMRMVGYLMSQADLIIGSDTGPVHLASALGRPTIALFGPYDPRHYFPYGHPERALYARVPCSPCRYRDCPEVDCMRLISPTDVARIADAVLRGKSIEVGHLSPMKTVAI